MAFEWPFECLARMQREGSEAVDYSSLLLVAQHGILGHRAGAVRRGLLASASKRWGPSGCGSRLEV